MTDEVEPKSDATRIQKPSDATTEAGVISSHANQTEHEKAFKLAHAADKTPSGIMPALHESFSIEGDLSPADTGKKFAKTQTAPDAFVAWDPQKWARDTANTVRDATNEAKRTTEQTVEQAWFPFRGKEDSQVDYTACASAYKAFPEFAKHPNVDRALIPALIRNELHFYNLKEKPFEGMVNTFGNLPNDSLSIGPAQIQKQNIERLMRNFSQLADPELGGITGNPLEAALNPAKAPWFVAALLAERIRARDEAGKPVTHQDLIQSYNPGGKVHFNNVHAQLIWIKTHHAGW